MNQRCLLVWLVVVLAGCAAPRQALLPEYQDVHSLAVTYARNKTLEPGLEERVTDVITQELMRDGRFRVVDVYDADLLIEPVVTDYANIPTNFDNDNRATGWELRTTVEFTVTDRATGELLMQHQPFSATGHFARTQLPGVRREDEIYRQLTERFISACFEGW